MDGYVETEIQEANRLRKSAKPRRDDFITNRISKERPLTVEEDLLLKELQDIKQFIEDAIQKILVMRRGADFSPSVPVPPPIKVPEPVLPPPPPVSAFDHSGNKIEWAIIKEDDDKFIHRLNQLGWPITSMGSVRSSRHVIAKLWRSKGNFGPILKKREPGQGRGNVWNVNAVFLYAASMKTNTLSQRFGEIKDKSFKNGSAKASKAGLLTVVDTAKRTGLPISTIRSWYLNPKPEFPERVYVGTTRIYFRAIDVDAFMKGSYGEAISSH